MYAIADQYLGRVNVENLHQLLRIFVSFYRKHKYVFLSKILILQFEKIHSIEE